MPKLFHELRERLLRAGVAPRHVQRYLAELADHLADLTAEEERAGRSRADAGAAALIRLGAMDDLANAMIQQRQFQSWFARAPWAMFGLAPLLVLAFAWFVALLILWSGWRIFLPGSNTPFVPIYELREIIYFNIGRMLYFGGPIFVGWGIGFIAARQRFGAAWPAAGLALIAWIGGKAQVHATSPSIPGTVGHVGVFAFGPYSQSISDSLWHALAIFTLTALPYLIWRFRGIAGSSLPSTTRA
jgi:hypothetical protein